MSKPVYTTALEAEAAFYDALARSDLEAMLQVWSEDDEVVCIHPDGARLVGLRAVHEAWRQLFSGGARLTVSVSQRVATGNSLLATHNVIEHVAVAGDDRIPPPMVATNVYASGPRGWKMIMHHASPAPEIQHTDMHDGPRIVH
ncbi:nuclear transport factor 2 family protein [Aromatoleum toluclasticum]|uniref:YybH family protein n=1 Tax=Aromatoleum toluclasticum TaxID=92003 RepID=UPI001D190586|nr:nuclear transport factor 2 family protein [Aromatoleum toluclasticum]MCC4118325.1 nuclear transport factor 2 family protein [Aromatoleum toluclasticum]